jgi:hypothetical protein
MNEDDVFNLADKAGLGFVKHADPKDVAKFQRFAALVASAEREKFCAVLRQLHDSYSLASNSNAIRARGQA